MVNDLTNPDHIVVGQQLEIPYVTFRYRVQLGDTKQKLAQRFYGDPTLSEIIEIPNGAAQRDLNVGEWLLIPDLAKAGHHTVVASETLEVLAERWYGDRFLWTIISIANRLNGVDPAPGTICSSRGSTIGTTSLPGTPCGRWPSSPTATAATTDRGTWSKCSQRPT